MMRRREQTIPCTVHMVSPLRPPSCFPFGLYTAVSVMWLTDWGKPFYPLEVFLHCILRGNFAKLCALTSDSLCCLFAVRQPSVSIWVLRNRIYTKSNMSSHRVKVHRSVRIFFKVPGSNSYRTRMHERPPCTELYCNPGYVTIFVNTPALWLAFVVLVNTTESLLFRKIVFRSFFTQLHLLFYQPIFGFYSFLSVQ